MLGGLGQLADPARPPRRRLAPGAGLGQEQVAQAVAALAGDQARLQQGLEPRAQPARRRRAVGEAEVLGQLLVAGPAVAVALGALQRRQDQRLLGHLPRPGRSLGLTRHREASDR